MKVSPTAIKEKMRAGKSTIKSRKVTGDASVEAGNESTTDDTVQLQKVHKTYNNERRTRKSENINSTGMKSRPKRGINWHRKLFKKSKSGREGSFGCETFLYLYYRSILLPCTG